MTSKTDPPKAAASQTAGQVAAQSRLGDPDEIDPGSGPEIADAVLVSPPLLAPPGSIPSAHASPTLPPSSLFETTSGVILIAEVSSVQCYAEGNGKTCQVLFRSGVFVSIDFRYSLGLIEAVKAFHAWSRMLGRVA